MEVTSTYSLEVAHPQKNTNPLFTIAVFCMAILLHQSQVIFGVNISFADLFSLFIFTALILKNQLLIPITPIIYFFIVSIVVLLTSFFYVPLNFMYTPDPMGIVSDYVKLFAIFIYFIFGYNLSHNQLMGNIVKWYSFFGVFIGGIGVFFTVFNIHTFSEILFYGGIRYRGLMIDPNYFSVLQITSLVYITRAKMIKMQYKYMAIFIIALSVIISGSKTGIITLFCYMSLRIIEYVFTQKKNALVVAGQIFCMVLFIIIVPIMFGMLQNLVNFLSDSIPAFSRVQLLFTNFSAAFSENGSGRNITWKVALQIIQLSPVMGIGIGTYRHIAIELFHESDISHNTFLQLSAEWGIPLALIFFAYVLFILVRATTLRTPSIENNVILRDIIIILLIGSMAISLNNARILWLVLGALVSSLARYSNPKNTGD